MAMRKLSSRGSGIPVMVWIMIMMMTLPMLFDVGCFSPLVFSLQLVFLECQHHPTRIRTRRTRMSQWTQATLLPHGSIEFVC